MVCKGLSQISWERKVGFHASDELSKKHQNVFVKRLGAPLDKELSNYLLIRREQ